MPMPKALREYWAKRRARTRTRTPKSNGKGSPMARRKGKIAIAPLIGAGVAGWMYVSRLLRYVNDAGYQGNPGKALTDAHLNMFGFADDGSGNFKFDQKLLMEGAVPIFGLALGGVAVHKLANMSGLNRAIARIPWISI